MSEQVIIDIFSLTMYTILALSLPMLVVALGIGLIIAVFQATTQIQEQTLAFVPKIIGVFLVMLLFGPWMIRTIMEFTNNLFSNISTYIY